MMVSKYLISAFMLIFILASCSEEPTIMNPIPNPDPDPVVTLHEVPGDFATIQEAISKAAVGDTVLVLPGEYFENINMSGKNILLTSRYYENSDVSFIKQTIINGSNGSASNGSVILTQAGENNSCTIQGFTLTKGTGTLYTSEVSGNVTRGGGGVMIRAGSSPTIRFNIIENNASTNTDGANNVAGGGGIRIERSTAKITNNVIRDNEGGFGGGVFLDQTACLFSNNIVSTNYASRSNFDGGGGLYLDFTFEGGAGNQIVNNTIVNNISEGDSDGLTLAGASVFDNLVFENNIIYGHEKESVFIRNGADSDRFIPNYSLIEGGWNQGEENLDLMPGFNQETFILSEDSPCIDAGNPKLNFNDSGNASLGSDRNDIGAFGGPLANFLL